MATTQEIDYDSYLPTLPMKGSPETVAPTKTAAEILKGQDEYLPETFVTEPVDLEAISRQAEKEEFDKKPFFEKVADYTASGYKAEEQLYGSVVETGGKMISGLANAAVSGWAAISQYLETEIRQDFGVTEEFSFLGSKFDAVTDRQENNAGFIRPSAAMDAKQKMDATQQYISDKLDWKSKYGHTDDFLHVMAEVGDSYEKMMKFLVGDPVNEIGNYVGMTPSDAAALGVGTQLATEYATPLVILRAVERGAKLAKHKTLKDVKAQEGVLARETISYDLALLDDMTVEINDVLTIQDKIPGYRAGIPQIARDTNIGTVENMSMVVSGNTRKFGRVQKGRRNAIKAFQDDMFGALDRRGELLDERIVNVAKTSEGSVKAIVNEIDSQLHALKNEQLKLSQKYSINNEERFALELQGNMHLQYRAEKFKSKLLYQSVGNPKVDAKPLLQHWDALMKDPQMRPLLQDPRLERSLMKSQSYMILKDQVARLGDMPSKETGLVAKGQVQSPPARDITMDFDALVELNKMLNKDIRRYKHGDNGNIYHFVLKTKDVVQKTLDDLAGSGVESAKKMAAANSHYKKVIINQYERGVIGDLIDAERVGDKWAFKTLGVDVLNKIVPVKGGLVSTQHLDDFLELYGHNPNAMQSFNNAMYDRFLRESSEMRGRALKATDGETMLRLDENNISKFVSKYQNIFDRMPELGKNFLSKEKLVHEMAKAKYALEQQKSQVQQSILFKMLGFKPEKTATGFKLQRNGEYTTDAYSAIIAATKSDALMSDVVASLGKNKQAKKGLSKAVGAALLKETKIKGRSDIDGQKLLDILSDPERMPAISRGMKPKHLESLKIIADAWEREKYSTRYRAKYDPEGGTFSGTKKSMGMTEGQILNDLRQASVGRIPKQLLITNFIVKVMRTTGHKTYEKAMAEVFMNEDVAKAYADLLSLENKMQSLTPAARMSKKIIARRERALSNYITTLATFGLISLDSQDQPQE